MDTWKIQTTEKQASTTSCRKHAKEENATFLANLRDHINEFVHASMDEHLTCFHNTINKMFGMSKAVEAKEVAESQSPPLQAANHST